MRRLVRNANILVENRFMWAGVFVLGMSLFLLFRLWYVQIYNGPHYQSISQRNRVRRIEIGAPRGVIYDRVGKVVLGNRPFFDLVYVPQYVSNKEATMGILSRLLHIPKPLFERRLRIGAGRPGYIPIVLKRNLSIHEVSVIESNKVFLPGIEVQVAPRREYNESIPAHLVGYLGEIDAKTLKRENAENPDNPYQPGDLIGKMGLERQWEKYLRGKRGYQFIQVDAHGRKTSGHADWELPEQPAIAGDDLELTLDWDLQEATREAFKGKYGAVVVLNPKTGEILSMLSAPAFDPTIYQEGLSQEEWRALVSNPFKPLYDKTTGGEFPPGSIYKAVVALAALEERVVSPSTTYYCPGYYQLGRQTFRCWERGGHGTVGLKRALMKSCDVYFYEVGVQLGVDRIAKYARALGLGEKLGLELNVEKPGLVPTSAWKQLVHRLPWTGGDTPNIAIGQGYNLMTPLQMASLYATISTNGNQAKPFLVRRIANFLGETVYEQTSQVKTPELKIAKESYRLVRDALQEVVMNKEGTGKGAAVEGKTVAGKTGSVQVVSLKKNRNQTDVSMKWKEHALFAAFSPTDDAEIAVAIVSENDRVGGGGASAAPVAGKILNAYWRIKAERAGGRAALDISANPETAAGTDAAPASVH